MRIRSFHIDAFGTLRDVTAEGLPEAGAVFLGHNEAGKSTLLDFFRSTLVGYPRTRDARERGYLAGQSGLLGGSLTLFSDARGGDIRLIRRPNVAKGEPLLTDAQGRPLDPALWERLLGGVTREVYASVYGFSLSELQSFASLTAEGVRNALYGASFGMAGLKSPGAALKKLTGSMEDLFRARGSNPRLSAALKEWEDVRRDMRRAEEDAARYDSLAAERDAAQGRLAALREERAERERERRVLERRLGVWERWEEWRLAGVRLERLEPVPATFPQDGPARLERALERRSDAERALEQARQRLEQAREDLGSRVADRALLDCGERLRELAGRAASCRNALAAIPGLCADRERALAALQRELAGLGPDWTAERVQRIGRPLSLREALERQAEQRRSAVSDMENAQAAVRRIAEDTKALESELEEQMRQAADVPEPPMALSEAERERLREAMARAEEARRRLPEAQTSSAEAERELDQALSRGRAAGRSKRCPQGRTRLPRWLRRFSIRKQNGKTASAGLRRLVPMRNVRGKRWRVCVSVGRHVPPVPPWTHSGRHCGVYVPPCPGWLWNMCALRMPNPAAPSMGPLPGRNPARLLSCSVPYWRCSGLPGPSFAACWK